MQSNDRRDPNNWIQEVPPGWALGRLKHSVSSIVNGVWGDEPTEDGNDVICIRVADFDRVRFSVRLEAPTYRALDKAEFAKRQLLYGDLLIEKSGGSGDLNPVGFVVRYEHHTPAVCSNFIARIRTSHIADSNFFKYVHAAAYSAGVNKKAIKQTTGIQNLDIEAYLNELVPYPPLDEQRAIASFLDHETAKLDQLVEKKQRLIELLQEYRQALITQAVTKGLDPNVPMKDSGIPWLGEVPAQWSIEKIKFFVNIYGGGTPAKDNLEYWNGDIPWVSPKDMKTELIDSTEEYITEKGLANSTATLIDRKSVLVVVRSGILKRSLPVAINVVPVSLNQDIKAIIPKKHVTVDYLGWVFKGLSTFILYLCKKEGATVDSIENDDLLRMPIPLPTKEEQDRICKYLQYKIGRLDSLISKLELQIHKIHEYRQTLISAAVTGQIDVWHSLTEQVGAVTSRTTTSESLV